ncbi:hypothetical protein H8S90_12690 [Olivibacter sp. SDN3]|uniref:glucoamylase family protein n=1 Tax=Olivibacter sp. SDN3 TaxID=2764720 RepID=UPI001651965C|nr:glucoamylase family protein [Olivibacter sp. SDN3]QNL47688.1 hypothetical protein H8S90_12690 [Olivibacter sp. SDN3]
MNKTYFTFFLFINCFLFQARGETYPEVLFDNSVMPKSYFYSQSTFSGDSWINSMNGHLPVSDTVFFTPGNALLLNYVSGTEGLWQAEINYRGESGYSFNKNDILIFKIFASADTEVNELPGIQLKQGENRSQLISLQKYITNYQDNTWLSIMIPVKDIDNLDENASITSILFEQENNDGKEHHVFIDQIEFLPAKTPEMRLTGKAMLTAVTAYERHVDITWQLPLTPSIRYIKIYRSEDNENFTPIAIRPIYFDKYTDFVPRTDVSYYYKIAWVDYKYRESPFSEIKKADTKLASDDELLEAVERAHIAYFTAETEFNSGMHKVNPLVSDAQVSVKGTGLGILTQIIGAERQFVPRQVVLDRLIKIVDFLGNATKYHGAFPELLDGRTGSPISGDSCQIAADLESTAYLMQGLLVSRNYFDQDEGLEQELREKVTALWEDVDWRVFKKDEESVHLYDQWSPACFFDHAKPLGGYNGSFIAYLLAIASPSSSMSTDIYFDGYKQPLEYVGPAVGRFSSSPMDTIVTDQETKQSQIFRKDTFGDDSTYYGMSLNAGKLSSSLIDLQQPFLAFDPRGKVDSGVDYERNQTNLANIFYRAALDKSEKFVSLTDVLWPQTTNDSLMSAKFSPSSAIATYPFTPTIALDALKNYYRNLGAFLWTEYGFRDEFDFKNNWVSEDFNAVNQAVVPVMLENGRTGLIWDLFMKDPDISNAATKLFGDTED